MAKTTIHVEVWSDIMCPYCYIGKKFFEKALTEFHDKIELSVTWKAFQLNQSLPVKGNGFSVKKYLKDILGLPDRELEASFEQMKQLADEAGVTFNLPNAIAANTRDAHRLIKLAAEKGDADKAVTLLEKAYFEDAKDYSDYNVLIEIGHEAGLTKSEIVNMLNSNQFSDEVDADINEAHQLGIDTVPTFLFNRKYAVIGSQPTEAFVQTLEKLSKENPSANDSIETKRGKSCSADGVCSL